MKKTFQLKWKRGGSQMVMGETIDLALRDAGYDKGARSALESYEEIVFLEVGVVTGSDFGAPRTTRLVRGKTQQIEVFYLPDGVLDKATYTGKHVVITLKDGSERIMNIDGPHQSFSVDETICFICKVFSSNDDAREWVEDQMVS